MRVAVDSDHRGVGLRQAVGRWLVDMGHEVVDSGPAEDEASDYPDGARRVCQAIVAGQAELGVLVCGSGVGMAIAANKHSGIRAVVCSEPVSASLSRQHNDANVLCMGSGIVGDVMAESMLKAFMKASFEGGRHSRRVEKLEPSC